MTLAERLREFGLFLRGAAKIDAAEAASLRADDGQREIALVGNVGSSYWPAFSAAPEMADGEPDPLDRWSRRVAESIAVEFGLRPLFPFEGPPYHPFQRWAARAEGLGQSPLGIMVHPDHGLWHSYRFALLGDGFSVAPRRDPAEYPCAGCAGQPCLNACPVHAFDSGGYDVARCADYLKRTPAADCHESGCIARLACPLAPELRYVPEQAAFHLRAFLSSRG